MLNPWLILLAAHFIGDYPLQGSYLAIGKKTSLYLLFVHCFVYAFVLSLTLFLLNHYSDWKFVFILTSHFGVDKFKVWEESHKEPFDLTGIDQGLHVLINFAMFLV